jgi:hypothetical protein
MAGARKVVSKSFSLDAEPAGEIKVLRNPGYLLPNH